MLSWLFVNEEKPITRNLKLLHYYVIVEVFAVGNIYPDSRHVFLAEVDSDQALRVAAEQKVNGFADDRERTIKTAVEDVVCDFLAARNILIYPLVAAPNTRRAMIGRVPDKQPDSARDGMKLWYSGEAKPACNRGVD